MKRILVLGAMLMHVPLIKRIKERGYYVITCDYIPESIGHKYADEKSFESTTDLDAVLNLAREVDIDGILTYNSDPAAYTAAFVAAKLGLPGNPVSAVQVMSEKDQFRRFLKDHGFNTPKFRVFSAVAEVEEEMESLHFPAIIKPVDSSGSKGVRKVTRREELLKAFEDALEHSRAKKVILEEFIEADGAQLHGDAFVQDGRVVFSCLGDHRFDPSRKGNVPFVTSFPSDHSSETIEEVIQEVENFIKKVGFLNGGINIEARKNAIDGKTYLIEVGPRNGGNFTPRIIEHHTGFNFLDSAIDACLGIRNEQREFSPVGKGWHSYLVLTSSVDGIFQGVELDRKVEKCLLESYYYKKPGDTVKVFSGANQAVGVLLLEYASREEMMDILSNYRSYIRVSVAENAE